MVADCGHMPRLVVLAFESKQQAEAGRAAVERPETDRLLRRRRARSDQAIASVSGEVHPEARFVMGDPVRALEAEAADGLDLLVMDSRGSAACGTSCSGACHPSSSRLLPCPALSGAALGRLRPSAAACPPTTTRARGREAQEPHHDQREASIEETRGR